MTTGVSLWIDLALLSVAMGISIQSSINLIEDCQTPILKETEDKTLLDVNNAIYVEKRQEKGSDLVMMLINADENIPYPKSIRINNTTIIDLDNTFFTQQQANIANIYSPSGEWKLGSMLDYNITNVEFVQDDAEGDYWQYTLEP